MIKLLVGLGNPGQRYQKTRHNAGFLLLDELAREKAVTFSKEVRFFGDLAEVNLSVGKLYLLKPATFMNRSGQSVSSFMKYYKINPEEVLVVHDELDFEVGTLKLKSGGGHGGHNGLRDIIASLGVKDFKRLRVGIGRPKPGMQVADYVLSDFSKTDVQHVKELFYNFFNYLSLLQGGDYELAMQELHSRIK
ncbi:peptidyl-tRNA hydrolase, PTH1 family [Bathymodiolus platifrons methanotrophic gill symbiont]|uniref:aminoacyl-tRNA hydrolase n=1 Tax=Bathymodiolus platifrons methanotrophic gill symbiont TaxID=113268 RepID=UPI000B40F574|nr:aminoacyl-tRNA hydrolase [Bathymodiolus platifrons methanotrophic gill symbiont]MCK5869431.1 aminoacyl-tRNA hydrolase [Methyloprofundus sp.]TXK97398.1 aminoacyl-tRNA hydrolase [Methylococcaceae bacterium CS4]TXK99752.1 aminoacyl-tRNA hydrolase [Methylococcaceae bacterium CS5]TXL06569.1 aminoacyl-tRNA hydrolase [Methylococcaceae bacterium CS1]TXL09509.1 aminoacyl-tRNA hydrolase [Methylococcaceae bacterium CS3]TXL12178.1 aminoacyl-tRNA hydrolase [Methylococcaceae bacterium CS2]TXL16289.1 am